MIGLRTTVWSAGLIDERLAESSWLLIFSLKRVAKTLTPTNLVSCIAVVKPASLSDVAPDIVCALLEVFWPKLKGLRLS